METCLFCKAEFAANLSFCPACKAPLAGDDTGILPTLPLEARPESAVLVAGTIFAGRYKIIGLAGEGAMGSVYRAEEQLGERKRAVAIKLLRADTAVSRKAAQRLIDEGAEIQNIRHPNVMAVYQVGEDGGVPFIVMPYVNGVTLRTWLRRRAGDGQDVPLGVAFSIIEALLDGLGAAHAAGIVHRDLKPENILLTAEPGDQSAALQILDFGLALGAGMASGSGSAVGTPLYMAPEQWTMPDSAAPSADIYSLSRIFYELLVGVLPQGHWQPPSEERGDVPETVDAIIRKGLSSRPQSRFQSAGAMRAAMDGVAFPSEAPPVTEELLEALAGFEELSAAAGGAEPLAPEMRTKIAAVLAQPDVAAAILTGDKLRAITLVRDTAGCTLMDAKRAVEFPMRLSPAPMEDDEPSFFSGTFSSKKFLIAATFSVTMMFAIFMWEMNFPTTGRSQTPSEIANFIPPDGGPVAGSFQISYPSGDDYLDVISSDNSWARKSADGSITYITGTISLSGPSAGCIIKNSGPDDETFCYDSELSLFGVWYGRHKIDRNHSFEIIRI